MLELIAVILAFLGLVAAYRFRPRRSPGEHPIPKDVVHATRWWRSRAFNQALTYMSQYVEARDHIATPPPPPRAITLSDLYTWGCNVLLTAASRISRYSQGKANLFVVNEVPQSSSSPSLTLRSQQFVGAFPLLQLTTGRTKAVYNYRVMPVNQSNVMATVASSAVLHNKLVFDRIGDHVSDEEKRLGTSHILAIPICDGIDDVEPGDVAAITVDFRLPRRVQFLDRLHIWQSKRHILKRAERLQQESRRFVQLLPGGHLP